MSRPTAGIIRIRLEVGICSNFTAQKCKNGSRATYAEMWKVMTSWETCVTNRKRFSRPQVSVKRCINRDHSQNYAGCLNSHQKTRRFATACDQFCISRLLKPYEVLLNRTVHRSFTIALFASLTLLKPSRLTE